MLDSEDLKDHLVPEPLKLPRNRGYVRDFHEGDLFRRHPIDKSDERILDTESGQPYVDLWLLASNDDYTLGETDFL